MVYSKRHGAVTGQLALSVLRSSDFKIWKRSFNIGESSSQWCVGGIFIYVADLLLTENDIYGIPWMKTELNKGFGMKV